MRSINGRKASSHGSQKDAEAADICWKYGFCACNVHPCMCMLFRGDKGTQSDSPPPPGAKLPAKGLKTSMYTFACVF